MSPDLKAKLLDRGPRGGLFFKEGPEVVALIEELERENGSLRAAFRVNMMRLLPNFTHAEIDAKIERAISI